MDTPENIALFDRFLMNEMSLNEKEAFDERLLHSESFKKEFEEYKSFANEISEGAEYSVITKELSEINTALYGKKKSRLFTPKFLIPIGIAASIALLIYINPFNMGAKTDMATNSYEPLENVSEESYAMGMEDSMNDDFKEKNTVGYMNSEADSITLVLKDSLNQINYMPHGTAFLISKNGFFLTSKHLVKDEKIIRLQQKQLGITFEAAVVYTDSVLDFAIVQSSTELSTIFNAVPYKLIKNSPDLGDEVFTLGYSKKDIVYTKGVVSSETGFKSDSSYFEVSLPSNAGHSGAPLFSADGSLIGIITAHHSNKEAVTYILKHDHIKNRLDSLSDSLGIDQSSNYSKRHTRLNKRIKLYRPFIFEVH